MQSFAGRFAYFGTNFLIRAWFVLAFVGGGSFLAAHPTHAATLYLSPSSGSYEVGKTFTISVMVSSPDRAVNAYSGTITYPTDKLEMTGIGKGGSIVSLWVQEPTYSAGRASFEGITLNPGYKGGAGRLVTLTFKAKATGKALVRIVSGAVLANDGNGTNVLSGLGSGTYTLVPPVVGPPRPPAPVVPPLPPPRVVAVPAVPVITSPSHPDPTKWYALNDVIFQWDLQSGVDGVSRLMDQSLTTDPGTRSLGLFSSSTFMDVQDGIRFFHLRVRNRDGWSEAAHYAFQIDTKKPDAFTITDVTAADQNQTMRHFRFDAVDSGSGIDHYEVRLDDGTPTTWVDDGAHIYRTPAVGPGEYVLHAKAFDKAGNFLEASAAYTVKTIAPPTITDYPSLPKTGDTLFVRGTAIPDATVTVWIQKQGLPPTSRDVKSDRQGNFSFVADDKLATATYQVWATVADVFGNVSGPSDKITLVVEEPVFDVWGWLVGFFLTYRCLLVILLLLLLIAYLLWKYLTLKKKMRNEVHGAKETLHRAFELMKDDVEHQVKVLEKSKITRELSAEEDSVLQKYKKALDLETLLERVSRLIIVPRGETPTVATVDDANAMRLQDPSFYRDAENGDRVLVWSDKAVLYSMSHDALLAVLPIAGPAPAPTPPADIPPSV